MPEATAPQTISLIGIPVELAACLLATHPDLADRTIVITGDTASPTVAEFLARLRTPRPQNPFDIRVLVQMVERFRVGAAS